jgi:hypothetical protein
VTDSANGGIRSCSVKRPWRRWFSRTDPPADAASRREDDARCARSPLPRPSTAESAARPSSRSATSTTTCACVTTIAARRTSAPRSRFAARPAGRRSRAAATCLLTCASAATATQRSRRTHGRGRRARAVGPTRAAAERPSRGRPFEPRHPAASHDRLNPAAAPVCGTRRARRSGRGRRRRSRSRTAAR